MVKTMYIGDFKAKFSEVVEMTKKGITIKSVKGKARELVGYFGKDILPIKQPERKIGFFGDLGIDIKLEDLHWSEDELKEMGL